MGKYKFSYDNKVIDTDDLQEIKQEIINIESSSIKGRINQILGRGRRVSNSENIYLVQIRVGDWMDGYSHYVLKATQNENEAKEYHEKLEKLLITIKEHFNNDKNTVVRFNEPFIKDKMYDDRTFKLKFIDYNDVDWSVDDIRSIKIENILKIKIS